METAQPSFGEILNATVRMLRTTWKAKVCLFLQLDDHGDLSVRASDGLPLEQISTLVIKTSKGPFSDCMTKNRSSKTEVFTPFGSLAAY